MRTFTQNGSRITYRNTEREYTGTLFDDNSAEFEPLLRIGSQGSPINFSMKMQFTKVGDNWTYAGEFLLDQQDASCELTAPMSGVRIQ